MKRKIVVLGSTGSVGMQTLDVIRANPDHFEVLAISAQSNTQRLSEQVLTFHSRFAGIADASAWHRMKSSVPADVIVEAGVEANSTLAGLSEADIVMIGISGIQGLPALLSALRAGKTVALANKESIVCGNPLVQEALQKYGGRIIPVDSEHSAIYQCLQNGKKQEVASLILTASGGPFRNYTQEQLALVTPEQAQKHPVWRMGNKICIDSATLFNKGLEVIEASFLFGFPNTHISVLIHPQSIVHSMVEYIDGTIMAQMAVPDMRLAIQYALGYPDRLARSIERLDFSQMSSLTFKNAEDHPAIRLAHIALSGSDALPITYNAANESAVEMFVQHRIGFLDIQRAVEHAMEKASCASVCSLQDVMQVDREARERVADLFG